jgi:hypothetical protein
VKALIDEDTHGWNKGLLETLFTAEEVDAILSIPLSSTNRSDGVIWRGSSNGIFTVKSAYQMAKEMSLEDKQGALKEDDTVNYGGPFGSCEFPMWRNTSYGKHVGRFSLLKSI